MANRSPTEIEAAARCLYRWFTGSAADWDSAVALERTRYRLAASDALAAAEAVRGG